MDKYPQPVVRVYGINLLQKQSGQHFPTAAISDNQEMNSLQTHSYLFLGLLFARSQ